MENQLAQLIELQNTDSAIKALNIKKNAMPARFSTLEDWREAQEKTLSGALALVQELLEKHKKQESTLSRAGDELHKIKSKQADVKTNKEYEALLKEIDVMNAKIGNIEEEIIGTLDEIEKAQAQLMTSEAEHKESLRKYEQRKKELENISSELEADLADLNVIQQTLKNSLPPDVVKKYEAIKVMHSGLAVSPVIKGVCHGCFMNIPPQLNNELMGSTTITLCPRCNRIIFFQPAEEDTNL